MNLKESLWNSQIEWPTLKAAYGLVIFPLFLIGVAFQSTLLATASTALSVGYAAGVVHYGVARSLSRYVSRKLRRAIRAETEKENRELDSRLDGLSREIGTKLSLGKDEEELLRLALGNQLERVKNAKRK